ncbi:hypothetical protein N665_0053s0019 [Sinapis alba]|nr:hypothetical protein N665_0053s0019 [Sinapis alba]
MKELVAVQKPIMLDVGIFGHWKARMRHIIRGIDEDAWTAVEEGWSAPTMIMEDKTVAPKPKNRWTDTDKAASKFNSKALTAICSAVDLDQFKIIQGCESAKDAWDTLINHFEGNTGVRRTIIDHLASRMTWLRNYSGVYHLGFEAYKAVLNIAVNTDEMKFDQLSGILKVHDLEKKEQVSNAPNNIVFAAESKENDRVAKIKDNLGLMARNFNNFVKRMEKGVSRSSGSFQRNDGDRSNSQSSRQESVKGSRKKKL